jgi:hypothetical protein
LVMVFRPPTTTKRNPKSFSLAGVGHVCKVALTTKTILK